MDGRDEELTIENVDEQIERHLARLNEPPPEDKASLARLVYNLHSGYAEKRRLAQVWEQINSRASALHLEDIVAREEQELSEQQSKQRGRIHQLDKRLRLPRRWRWRDIGIGLAAAVLLLSIIVYSVWAYAFHNTQVAEPQPTATPQFSGRSMKEYDSQYFKIQYPAEWIIAGTTPGSGSSYLQTVQFHPSGMSSVVVNVEALPATDYSSGQLLSLDADVKLGKLSDTHTVTYHGIPWTVGIVELGGSAQGQTGKLEIAYSNEENPYRLEFGATPQLFETYSATFDAMFASFYPQPRTAIVPTVVPQTTPSPTVTPPSTTTASGAKVYHDHYFSIQYPAGWVMTGITKSSTYVETVQFSPSASSPVYVDVNVLHSTDLSAELLLLTDPDLGLVGTLLSTSTVTYHGIPWSVGVANELSATTHQMNRVEVAYSNQNAPYRIKFNVPANMYSSYSASFTAMFASFYPAS